MHLRAKSLSFLHNRVESVFEASAERYQTREEAKCLVRKHRREFIFGGALHPEIKKRKKRTGHSQILSMHSYTCVGRVNKRSTESLN